MHIYMRTLQFLLYNQDTLAKALMVEPFLMENALDGAANHL